MAVPRLIEIIAREGGVLLWRWHVRDEERCRFSAVGSHLPFARYAMIGWNFMPLLRSIVALGCTLFFCTMVANRQVTVTLVPKDK